MTEDHWSQLSERLKNGDYAAAEDLFVSYAPYLRMVVRRQLTPRLRTRFDSHDVVQSVWAETLLKAREEGSSWQFRDASGLRSFLVRLTRNRFIDFYRRHRPSLQRERPFGPNEAGGLTCPRGERPSEQAHRDEVWDHLLRLCPPAHHELLRLKSGGASLGEIAERTGLHASSVRRILYELAERYSEHEGRRETACLATSAG